jgi:DinB family protein
MDLRYPVGQFDWKRQITPDQRHRFIDQIEEAPARLRAAVEGLSPEQIDTPYRPSGWTVRQVVHHLPDSHLNAYIRFKLALTEQEPAIKTYDQDRWSELVDAKAAPLEPSLKLLESLHKRWVFLLRSLSDADLARTLRHPEWGVVTLENTLAQYAWHSRHHVAHITSLRERMGWHV